MFMVLPDSEFLSILVGLAGWAFKDEGLGEEMAGAFCVVANGEW